MPNSYKIHAQRIRRHQELRQQVIDQINHLRRGRNPEELNDQEHELYLERTSSLRFYNQQIAADLELLLTQIEKDNSDEPHRQ